MRVVLGALACAFICSSVNRFGRRGMLLLSAIITGLSSLLLLGLTQCRPRPQTLKLMHVCSLMCVCVCVRQISTA